jgi:glucose/mannose-6-phosphate isomerase
MQELRTRFDATDMLGRVLGFPEQMEAAWKVGAGFARAVESLRTTKFERVVVAGMGGSAIGGDLAKSFRARTRPHRSGVVATTRSRRTWRGGAFVASSCPGNTSERWRMRTQRAASPRPWWRLSGGELAARAAHATVPCCIIPGGMPPRAAIGFSLLPMLHVLRAAGTAAFKDAEYEEALAVARERCAEYSPSRDDNAAIALAKTLHGKTAFVYAAPSLLEGVARRWSCQINENAKTLAHFAFFPELNHNEIVGWEVGDVMAKAVVVSLEDRDDHPMTRRHADVGLSLMKPFAGAIERFEAPTGGRLSRMLAMMLLGDFTSVYLAYLNEVDPTPVKKIEVLKKELSR